MTTNISSDEKSVLRLISRHKKKQSKQSTEFYVFYAMIWLAVLTIIFIASCRPAHSAVTDEEAVKCIIGEASNQGKEGMYAVASALLNRGTTRGVYGCNAPHVRKEPKYVFNMAKEALEKAKIKRLHKGDHWENISAFGKPKWAYSMKEVYRHKDHVFYVMAK